MTRDAGRVVIVGGGLAGYSAADTLRALGHSGAITIVDPEPAAYDRPPLSKDLFRADFSLEKIAFADAAALAAKAIDARFGRAAVAVDAQARTVTLDDGDVIPADTILLATGGRPRTLPIPGGDLPQVRVLRTFADAVALRESVTAGTRVAVVGAGLIGAELASALQTAGAEVTLIDPVETPLVPAVGEHMAGHLHGMHTAKGLTTIQGLTAAFEPGEDGVDVVLDGGRRIAADLVVVGIGIVPNTELAEAAGIDVDGGVIVDARHRTSADGVYAAGDVCRRRDDEGALLRRAEHWESAQLDGQRAARDMLGQEPISDGAAWFWSDRHGIHLEATGRLTGAGQVVIRPGDHPTVFLVDDGALVGAAAIDDTMTIRAARRLIDQRIPVTAAELADPSVGLRGLLRAAR
ncbi:NAD(P)/FAD-dependent oxidoreductase [Microbacterium thalassium]|uniref:NADPH-dependent 2,4-dienoyl-CoA reductase/sulfur reductase-like enzyme n=1 Tax=Microbacterium thalassium TaxID=362649 RepID=A0A7X0FLR1_9MICO|nr:FAD-dependent oxidoreductase [Microbacterium thalassium]MBB6389818.1 NADPH-dependent 2,4-dienoyl-CoA reductase/sulfur reductase-like enzyme [Microbacterium thalassium]GLK24506.1 hypothetical rubredoxin/ferredoxin reductase [Microbacterium thalassium]